MNGREYLKIINDKWPYMLMRPPKDKLYHDGVSERQLLKWRKEWLRGALFGWINPVPDYKPESFDCDKEVVDFIAFCTRKNAATGKALPICKASVQGHVIMMFVDGGIKLFDVRACEIYASDMERPLFLELL